MKIRTLYLCSLLNSSILIQNLILFLDFVIYIQNGRPCINFIPLCTVICIYYLEK